MKNFNTKNCALLAICLCANVHPAQQNNENFLASDAAPKYTRMRPPPIAVPKICDCSEHEENIKKTNPNNHAGRDFFKHWRLNQNILPNDKRQ